MITGSNTSLQPQGIRIHIEMTQNQYSFSALTENRSRNKMKWTDELGWIDIENVWLIKLMTELEIQSIETLRTRFILQHNIELLRFAR